jgi:3-keto-disaccharide hydrolase
MKFIALIFSLVLTFAGITAAQDSTNAISPTNLVELFNGTNFDGFTFCMTADADPAKTWIVTNGVIHCTGAAVGYLRTLQSYSNYVVTVEWRFIKVAPKKDNTGVLVHMQLPDKVWPPCIQNQGKSGRQGDLFVMSGVECKEHLALGKDANTPVALHGAPNENAIGEWNTNVTVCAGNNVQAIINGKLLNEITECTVSSGFVGIQSEGADFEIRKMYLEPVSALSLLPPGATDLIEQRQKQGQGHSLF